MLKRGQLNEFIEIWQSFITKNEFGELVNEFNFKNRARCKVRYDSGQRLIQNQEIFYSYIRTFIVDEFVDINEFNRIKYKGQFYQINNIQHIVKDRILIVQTSILND